MAGPLFASRYSPQTRRNAVHRKVDCLHPAFHWFQVTILLVKNTFSVLLVEITIGTACEGMVAVHIALTWALGIVYGTGYFLMFFCGRKFGSGSIDVCGAALC